MAVFIETCPKCEKDLTKWTVWNLPYTDKIEEIEKRDKE